MLLGAANGVSRLKGGPKTYMPEAIGAEELKLTIASARSAKSVAGR